MNRLLYWLLAISIPVICLWLLMPGDITQAERATLCVRPDGANGCYVTIQEAVNAAARWR